jgi:hypothetical protein
MAKRGRPFEAGNKFGQGRPIGSRNKKALIIEELLEQNSEPLLHKALKLAEQGNIPILRLLLDRVLPRPKDPPVSIGPLPMRTPEELLQAQANVMQEIALGQLTLNQAEQIFSLIEARCRLLHTQVIEQRLSALEERRDGEPNKAA